MTEFDINKLSHRLAKFDDYDTPDDIPEDNFVYIGENLVEAFKNDPEWYIEVLDNDD